MLRTRCHTIVLPLALGLLAGALPVGHAAAQTAKDLAGTWTVASVAAEQDGSETQPYGADPKGILMLDDSGRYALVLLRADLPAFASENRTAGTPEENRAVVQGSIAHFGTYAIEGDTLVFHIEASTFPNWDEAEQKRPFTLTGDKLKYTVPAASGGGRAEVVWTRAR